MDMHGHFHDTSLSLIRASHRTHTMLYNTETQQFESRLGLEQSRSAAGRASAAERNWSVYGACR